MEASEFVKGVSTIASLPSVYQRLSQVMNHPRSSAHDIGRVTSEDPGLTARLLKLVNSAFFGFPSKIETVTRAVMIVGTEQLRELSLATSVISMFKDLPPDLVDMNSFWKHSLACGVFARVLANRMHESNIERFFVAGLLHDLGSIVVYLKKPDDARKILESSINNEALIHLEEKKHFGFDHAEIGQLLLKEWRLPESLQEAVGFHHSPDRAIKYPLEATVTHIADILANTFQWGSSGETHVAPIHEGAWESLKIKTETLTDIVNEAELQFAEVVKIILKE